jgi:hypothetical protein
MSDLHDPAHLPWPVRDEAALNRLPDDERQQWQVLWQEVADLRSRFAPKP